MLLLTSLLLHWLESFHWVQCDPQSQCVHVGSCAGVLKYLACVYIAHIALSLHSISHFMHCPVLESNTLTSPSEQPVTISPSYRTNLPSTANSQMYAKQDICSYIISYVHVLNTFAMTQLTSSVWFSRTCTHSKEFMFHTRTEPSDEPDTSRSSTGSKHNMYKTAISHHNFSRW